MSAPLVSVLMPSHGHARWVEEAVRSVMAQEGVSFELLVVDDGSPDESPEILRRLADELGFDLVCRENRGLVPTLNEMVGRARGKYFCTHASDDVMAPGRLAAQSGYLERHPGEPMCFGQIVLMDAGGRLDGAPDPRYARSVPRIAFDEFFMGEKEVHGCTEMIRLDVFRGMGGYDPEFPFEDFPLWLGFLRRYGSLPVLPTVCCHYRRHGDNMSRDVALMYGTFLKALARHADHPRYKEALNVWKSHWFSALAYRDKREALRMLPKLASLSPAFLGRFPKLFVPKFLLRR